MSLVSGCLVLTYLYVGYRLARSFYGTYGLCESQILGVFFLWPLAIVYFGLRALGGGR